MRIGRAIIPAIAALGAAASIFVGSGAAVLSGGASYAAMHSTTTSGTTGVYYHT